MNERIKQLAYKAGLHNHLWLDISDSDDVLDTVKFAQLIVRECEQVSLKNSHRDDDMGAIIARQIRQHFGVES